ncbi:mannosyl-glycoprotein endo-beta-N-acetylglucosaminidase [Alternaria panax]|uniref:Mannosyl-glycoprotein endo-beta-N-acetylglucosaminidase n=1 Tax=Alternaria panax TaxID=48097 RepID=A0AAD4NVD4_9PLEO|nr:mannosyl-glycoprotein endo-beta-N-acetylglucosaminidase [Alternaria panax]
MAHLLDWKDILRPIRDGYRHLFPTPDTGPTPEERRKQREVDRLKGFAYFDTFDQLESWKEADSDPLQRANTPLLRGPGDGVDTDDIKVPVLLIHDYSGNYHDYESVNAVGVDKEFYSCEYLQFVDSFVYFSHKLVCVPPPTWTNTLHRNGVEVLGTLLIEPQTSGSERLLQHTIDESGTTHFPMASKLASIATHYGFDGWLVNVEKPFPSEVWNAKILEAFLRQLKANLGVGLVAGRRLIWYDALTTSNRISYQNQVNDSNMEFAIACGNILTNYCWKDVDVSESVKWCTYSRFLPKGNIYFGVDVWAQNKSDFRHPRVTWPEVGGGGTNTGMAVAKMADYGLAAGIFAPAWSFEHFPGHERDVERMIWEGTKLLEGIECSCGDCKFWHPQNREWSILRTARERPAGSEHFFYTDFSRAFSTHGDQAKDTFDGHDVHAQFGQQSILPRPEVLAPLSKVVTLSHHIANEEDAHVLVIEATQHRPYDREKEGQQAVDHIPQLVDETDGIPFIHENTIEERLPLYKLDMPADGSLQLSIVPSIPHLPSVTPETCDRHLSIYYKTTSSTHHLPVCLPSSGAKLEDPVPDARITELGIHLKGPWTAPVSEPVRLLGIKEICITPRSTFPIQRPEITHVRLEERGEAEGRHVRICWNYNDVSSLGSWKEKGMPFSDVTGPFSYFEIDSVGRVLGRSYALEHILDKKFVESRAGDEVEIEVVGIGFDACTLAKTKVKVRL